MKPPGKKLYVKLMGLFDVSWPPEGALDLILINRV